MSVVLLGSTSGSITLQEPAVAGTNTVNFGANTGVAILDANTPAFRNRIINGAMVIDQRNAGASYTQVNGAYNLDRWAGNSYNGGAATNKFSVQRSTTAPTGFSNSLLVTSLSASSTTTSDIYNIEQKIEGFNTSDLMFGTASAATTTLSFWVRSSLTGTFGGAIKNEARNRAYPFTYTISAANTFEFKTITITGDTTGTWVGATNGTGLYISFGLGVGSGFSGTAGAWGAGDLFSATGAQYLISTNGATFYITGVQLEKGSTATSFDYRSYGQELALCYRYFQKFLGSSTYEALPSYVIASSSTAAEGFLAYKTTMRSAPSIAISTLCLLDGVGLFSMSGASVSAGGTDSMRISFSGLTGLTQYRSYYVTANGSTSAFLTLSSEL
jgi:hypothetical protein